MLYSLLVILLCCLPWLTYVYIYRDVIIQALSWHKSPAFGAHSIIKLFYQHLRGFSQVFINFDATDMNGTIKDILQWLTVFFIFFGFIYLYRNAGKKKFWFISLISLTGVVMLITVDEIRSSFISNLARYQLLNFAGIILLLSYIFTRLYEKNVWIFSLLFLPLVTASFLSSKTISEDPCIYKRSDCYYYIEDIPEYFSGNEKVLIISDFKVINPYSYSAFMSIMNVSPNNNIDILYSKPAFPDFRQIITQNNYDNIYAIYLTDSLRTYLHETFTDSELVVEKDRKLYNTFDLPFYSIQVNSDTTANTDK